MLQGARGVLIRESFNKTDENKQIILNAFNFLREFRNEI